MESTVVLGVNDHVITKDARILSNASCTTNCAAPVVHVLHRAFGIRRGLLTTINPSMLKTEEQETSVTITLPRTLEAELQNAAAVRDLSVEELALAILGHAVAAHRPPTPEEVVAEIRATPTSAAPASGASLAEALHNASEDPEFELEVPRLQSHSSWMLQQRSPALSMASIVRDRSRTCRW